MPRGKQLDNQTVYNIMLSYFLTNNFTETAKELNIPIKTVETIVKKNKDLPEYAKLRNDKKDEFVEKATKLINKALDRLDKELSNKDNRITARDLSIISGTLYDKRALANGESTENTAIVVKLNTDTEEWAK